MDNERTELHQFQKQLSYNGYLSPWLSSLNSTGQSTLELESINGNIDGQTNGQKIDKQTDGITSISKAT